MSNNNSHQNTRPITIFRANNFLQRAQDTKDNEGVASYQDLANRHIGPYLQSNTSKIIGSGLNIQEQELLLPHVIQIDADDKEFKKAVFNFFNELTTKIPPTTGKTLETGLLTDNKKPVSKTNMPIDIEDYVRYRHAKNHPWVAASRAEAEGNSLKSFYMNDPEADEQEKMDKLVLQDKADGIWMQIRNQQAKITMLLTLMGKDEREFLGKNGEAKAKLALRTLIDNEASRFIKIYEEERFETRYWLKAMITAGIVSQVGESYIITASQKLIGKQELETLLFLEDEKNTDTVTFLKSNTQDALRKPLAARRRTDK